MHANLIGCFIANGEHRIYTTIPGFYLRFSLVKAEHLDLLLILDMVGTLVGESLETACIKEWRIYPTSSVPDVTNCI